MSDCLVLLNPRDIPECMSAFEQLDIPRIHIVGHNEMSIMTDGFDKAIDIADAEGFDWLWWISDDAIVRQPALAAVRSLRDEGHPVVTGYSNMTHDNWYVNLCKTPLAKPTPVVDAYDLYRFHEVIGYPDPVVPTFFGGFCLTGMSLDMWRYYPFGCFGGGASDNQDGYGSDFSLSWRLQTDMVPIVAARDGFCFHWRWNWLTMPKMTAREAKAMMNLMIPTFDDPNVTLRLP
jgi:hypothetical protein